MSGNWCAVLGMSLLASACSGVPTRSAGVDKLTYHGDAARSGWNAREQTLTPARVSGPEFGLLWSSEALDSFGSTPPRLFATPLYVDRIGIRRAGSAPQIHSVVYAASTTGFVYAINARATPDVPAGAILWRRQLTTKPCTRGSFGVLGTPVIDLRRHRIYVAACDDTQLWTAAALDLRSGDMLPGWPVRLDAAAINAPGINHNGGNQFPDKFAHLQRSALNLSPDGRRLYVTFGAEPTSGWLISVDTVAHRVASAFSATAKTDEGVGGMWASGGPAVDSRGHIYVSTGSSVLNTLAGKGVAGVFPDSPGNWGQSVIELRDSQSNGLELAGTYTPFDYCQTGAHDMDIGSSSPALIDLDPRKTQTPHLLALGGGKQGNAYLLDREHMPGSLSKRQPCSTDSSSDASLLAPEAQPQFGKPGPLNVFGPYTDEYGMGDQARSRTTLAHFRNADGADLLFLTGSSKTGEKFTVSAAPGLARLKIVTDPAKPAYLAIDALQPALVFQNPGSPMVTSNGPKDAIVWVLDANKPRSAALYGADSPQPVLYAVDAATMQLLWRSSPGELHTSGKYNEPTISGGVVYVGTDRIQAFGLRGRTQ
jgi:hypothetical protein